MEMMTLPLFTILFPKIRMLKYMVLKLCASRYYVHSLS